VSPSRTVRTYLEHYTEQISAEHRIDRDMNLMRAIESQRAIAAAAWDAYEREGALQAEILASRHDFVRRTVRPAKPGRPRNTARPGAITRDAAAPHAAARTHDAREADTLDDLQDGDLISEEIERPRLPAQGARYLALALAAQREIARLQQLDDAPPTDEPTNIEIIIARRPDGPENIPPAGALDPNFDPDADRDDSDNSAIDCDMADRTATGCDTTGADPADEHPHLARHNAAEDPAGEPIDDAADLLVPDDALPTVTRRASDQPVEPVPVPLPQNSVQLCAPSVTSVFPVPPFPHAHAAASAKRP
jgi:hypothetical protein